MTPEELKKALHGICAIAVTPMDQNLNVDYDKMARHIRWLIEKGINKSNNCTLVVGGSTGECCTKDVMDLLEDAEAAKAAGAMVLSPYYYVPTDGTVARFYKEISKASGLGILLYNNLEVTHKDVPEYVIEELVNESNVVGIKECTPNFVKMERMVRRVGNMISVINGHGEFLEPFAALAGTVGFISSTSNFAPGIAVEMWKARSAGDYVAAKKIRDRLTPYLDLAASESATGGEPIVLAILKRAATLAGSDCGYGRIPLPEITPELDKKIGNMLEKVGLI